jgi:GNAT superfamily N-acetyltransferase
LAVSRDSAGLGFGVELLDHARKLAGIQGLTYLWLECPADNARLRQYYLDAGFTYCGDNSVPGPNGEPWVSSVFERRSSSLRGARLRD